MCLTSQHIDKYHADGAVMIPGLLHEWVDVVAAGIERNMVSPGPYAGDNVSEGEAGRFFDDYCNWTSIPEFEDVIRNSPVAEAAAALMKSGTAQIFHDHVLVKEPGTTKPTPWHQDSPYYFVEGTQTVSFWCPVDPITNTSIRCVAGSHRWDKPVLPVKWLSDDDFYPDSDTYMPVPDPDAEGMRILEWEMQPGDVVAFDYRVLHGARGNTTEHRRRAFSVRFVGDDAQFVERPGRTSPPFPGHNMVPGQRLREDWFPVVFSDAG